jgi:hypothetical protein
VLRVDDLPAEVPDAGEGRQVALVVAVVAAAHQEEAAGQRGRLAVRPFGFHGPPRLFAGPRGPRHPVAEANVLLDPRLGRGGPDVAEDRRAVRDRLGLGPRPEPVAEREHVRVRSHARIAEQVPGAADDVPGLEDRVRLGRERGLQVMGRADPGQPRPHDQDVTVFNHFGLGHLDPARRRFSSRAITS